MKKYLTKNFGIVRVLFAILIGILIAVALICIVSETPLDSIKMFFVGPFRSKVRMGNLVDLATVILFCGLASAIPFQAGLFCLGAEGGLYFGAALGTAFAVSTNLPAVLHIPCVLIIAVASGALCGFISGYLKAKWNASELVTSLMMNYACYYIGMYLINYYFRDGEAGYFVSYELPKTTWLTQFVPGTRINTGVILAVLFVVACYLLIYKTKLGYEMRAVGINKEFAKYGGINIKKVTILAAVLGAAIAGIGGMTQVMGIYRKFNWNAETGYGWDGIAVAIIARNNPLLIVPASIFLAYLRVGGGMLNLNSDVPTEMISIIQAVIILLITAESFLSSWKTKLTVSNALEVKD